MSKSRYADTAIIDDHHFATWRLPVRSAGLLQPDLLEGVRTFEYTLKAAERADHLAARFFNDEGYWWILALINNIDWPFASGGWVPGRKLIVPFNVQDVLEKIHR